MAESALGLPAPSSPAKAHTAVETPSSWDNPRGDARIEGRLTNVDCSAQPITLHVGKESLRVLAPDRIVLKGLSEIKAELHCGSQDVAVVVEYKSATREVTSIEFRF